MSHLKNNVTVTNKRFHKPGFFTTSSKNKLEKEVVSAPVISSTQETNDVVTDDSWFYDFIFGEGQHPF